MTDANTESTPASHAPISLLANSYDLQSLLKATKHAEGLKTDKGRADAFAKIARDEAALSDVVKNQNSVALPEGTVLAKVEDAQGRKVEAPVASDKAAQESEQPPVVTPPTAADPNPASPARTEAATTKDSGKS